MIEDGKTPKGDNPDPNDKEGQMELEVAVIMLNKFYRAIEFFQETKKPDQVKLVRQEIQNLSKVLSEMKFYFELDF